MTATTSGPHKRQLTFFGHPWGLSTLFLTETWERFSYYGMRAILLYYMYQQTASGGLGIDPALSRSLVNVYGAAIYLSGIVGGWFADRMLGSRRSITWGAVLIMFAHICLAAPGGGRAALFASMVLLVVGTGLLKPNITKAVGDLYDERDSRRAAGFTLFVMGVQIGAFVAAPAVSALANTDPQATDPSHNNFHVGFGLAAIGMAIGLLQYLLRPGTLSQVSTAPSNPLDARGRTRAFATMIGGLIAIAAMLALLAQVGLLSGDLIVYLISGLSLIVPIGYFFVMLRSSKVDATERSRVRAFIPLFIAMVVFWFVEEQQSSVLAEYAQKQTDLRAVGFLHALGVEEINPEWAQSINPITMLIFSPLVAWMWIKLGNRQPNTPRKFAIGLWLTGLGFVALFFPSVLYGVHGLANPAWLILGIGLFSVGELFINPVSLSATTALAPAAFVSQVVGLNYAADSAGQGLIALASKFFYSVETSGAYFGSIGVFVVLCGVALWFFAPVVHRKMAGVD